MAVSIHQDVKAFLAEVAEILFEPQSQPRRILSTRIPRRPHTIIDVDDVLVETWLAVQKNPSRFQRVPATDLKRLLAAVACCTLRAFSRKTEASKRGGHGRGPPLVAAERNAEPSTDEFLDTLPSSLLTPPDALDREETAKMIFDALPKLSPLAGIVIVMRFYKGLPVVEIARRLHRSPESVRRLLRRALREVRRIIPHD